MPNAEGSQAPLGASGHSFGTISPDIRVIRGNLRARGSDRQRLEGLLSPEAIKDLSGSQTLHASLCASMSARALRWIPMLKPTELDVVTCNASIS